MNIVICDDDPLYAQEIKNHLSQELFLRRISFQLKVFTNSLECVENIEPFDIAFLDVQMQPYNGMEIAKRIKEHQPNVILFFITSYYQYLDDAMDLNAFRYLKKPLDEQRLLGSFRKAIIQIEQTVVRFQLKSGAEYKSVQASEIIFVEIVGHHTRVMTEQGFFDSDWSIQEWNKKLSAPSFYNVHKSFIVNMKYLSSYKRDSITLADKWTIPIAYRKQTEFRHFFFEYFGGR